MTSAPWKNSLVTNGCRNGSPVAISAWTITSHPRNRNTIGYMAEQLNLDIIPIFIDGFGKVLPKESFHLHPGNMTIEVMPRIRRDDPMWEKGYREVTRQVHAMCLEKKQ